MDGVDCVEGIRLVLVLAKDCNVVLLKKLFRGDYMWLRWLLWHFRSETRSVDVSVTTILNRKTMGYKELFCYKLGSKKSWHYIYTTVSSRKSGTSGWYTLGRTHELSAETRNVAPPTSQTLPLWVKSPSYSMQITLAVIVEHYRDMMH